MKDLRHAASEAPSDRVEPEAGGFPGELLLNGTRKEGLRRRDQTILARGVNREVPPFPREDEEEIGKGLEDGPVAPLALPERLLGPAPLDGKGDLRRDEEEEIEIVPRVTDVARVALDGEDADGPLPHEKRNAEPVDRRRPDEVHLSLRDEPLEDLRAREERLPSAQDISRQPPPGLLRVRPEGRDPVRPRNRGS